MQFILLPHFLLRSRTDSIDSDHYPVEVEIEDKGRGGRKERKEKKGIGVRGKWDKEGREEFERKLGDIEIGSEVMLDQWERLKIRIGKC